MSNQPFYHLRANKYIDRNLFVQTLSYLRRVLPIADYHYIGFGSYLFDDFKSIHNKLDISNMISLESDAVIYNRAKFNIPFNCIELLKETSTTYISGVTLGEQNSIFWLDYTDPRELGNQFSDFCSLLNILNPNDIIRITLNANPSSLGAHIQGQNADDLHASRLAELKNRIEPYVPSSVVAAELTAKRYPLLLLKCLKKAALNSLEETPPFQNNFLFPLSSSIYADGQQMVTFTGIVLDDHKIEEPIRKCFEKFDYANFAWDKPHIIRIPELTHKEVLHINKLLPSLSGRQKLKDEFAFVFPSECEQESIDSYLSYYKYYPNFHHVNF